MPSYNYRCLACSRVQAVLHPANERHPPPCCGEAMQWQFPCPAISTDTRFMSRIPESQRRGSGYLNTQMDQVVYGRDDIKRHCEREGIGCEGAVTVKRRSQDVDPGPYRPGEVHVEREVQQIVDDNHGGRVTPAKRADLTEAVTERFSGKQ